MTHDPTTANIDALDVAILAYGVDRSRWPAATARRLAGLSNDGHMVRQRVREAGALDDLLASAAAASETPARAELVERIMAGLPPRAIAGPRSTVVALADHRPRAPQSTAAKHRPAVPLRAASMLAASLLIGVIAGTAGHDTGLVDDVSQRLGITDMVYADAGWAGEEEDVL